MSPRRDRWIRSWDRFGQIDPYYGVCSDERFHAATLDDQARAAFFSSGRDDVARVLADITTHVAPAFHPRRTLDFGCGVGRLTIPLAAASECAVGIDVSQGMLEEARRNAAERHVENVAFVASIEAASAALLHLTTGRAQTFDFVHSFIVFQHIPPKHGLVLASRLLPLLAPGGIAALHFTYARRAPRLRRFVNALRAHVPFVNGAANLIQGKPPGSPMMAMVSYNLAAVLQIFSAAGCNTAFVRLTDHGGHLGAMIYSRKGA